MAVHTSAPVGGGSAESPIHTSRSMPDAMEESAQKQVGEYNAPILQGATKRYESDRKPVMRRCEGREYSRHSEGKFSR